MDEDNEVLGFLDGGNEAAVSKPTTETPPEVKVETAKVETPPTDKKEEPKPVVAAADGQKTLETPKPGTEEPKTVPLATFLETLNENKELKKQAKSTEKPSAETTTFTPPDPVKQPREYAAYQEQVMSLNLMNERMNNSERFARKSHGNELVDKVRTWAMERFDTDDAFADKIINDADPYEAAVAAYNEHLRVDAFKDVKPDELTAFRAWQANQGKPPADASKTVQPGTKVLKPQPAADKPPPRSIADEISAGGAHVVPTGDGQAFDSLFKP